MFSFPLFKAIIRQETLRRQQRKFKVQKCKPQNIWTWDVIRNKITIVGCKQMKFNKDAPRYRAGKGELIGGTGGITRMCPAGNFLEMYKIDKTFRIYPPEILDPKETDPNMPWMSNSVADVGSANKIVARVFIQSHEAVNEAPLRKDIKKEEIIVLSHKSKELLLSCEKTYLEFFKKYEECVKQFKEGKVKKEGNVFPSFPLIDNLDDITVAFLSNAKKFIETEAKITNEFFQTHFDGPRFDIITDWVKKNLPNQKEFSNFLESTNDKLKHITDLRNHQEHPQKNKKTHINNFRLLPHNQIGFPTWHVTGNEEFDIRTDMDNIINFLMQFFEVLMFNCIMINLNTKLIYKVEDIPEEQRDKNCPIRFKLVVRLV